MSVNLQVPHRSSSFIDSFTAKLLFGEHNGGLDMRKRRLLPVIFRVNGESRAYCLEQYVPFANTYIHPKLDILFFSNDDEKRFLMYAPSFHHIPNHPVAKLQTVAIETEYGNRAGDFGGHLTWMSGLGCPTELVICLFSDNRSTMDMLAEQYLINSQSSESIDSESGNKTHLMQWPSKVDANLIEEIKPKLLKSLQDEMKMAADFKAPKLAEGLFFANTML